MTLDTLAPNQHSYEAPMPDDIRAMMDFGTSIAVLADERESGLSNAAAEDALNGIVENTINRIVESGRYTKVEAEDEVRGFLERLDIAGSMQMSSEVVHADGGEQEHAFTVARDIRSFAWEIMMSNDEWDACTTLITDHEATEMIEDLEGALGGRLSAECSEELQRAKFALEALRGDYDHIEHEQI